MGGEKMVMRSFIEAREKEVAISILESALADADKYIKSKEIWDISPYWKYDDMHVAKVFIVLEPYSFQDFTAVFSDTWEEYGIPIVDKFLASKNDVNCSYIKEGFALIVIDW